MNLNGLGKALMLYASTNNDHMPSLGHTENWTLSASAAAPVARNSIDEFWGKEKGCNLQAYYLLVEDGFISQKSFQCPSDLDWKEKDPGNVAFGFDSWANSSYGLQITNSGYHSSLAHLEQMTINGNPESQPASQKTSMSASTIIAADQPQLKQNAAGLWMPDRTKPSPHHKDGYLNLLHADGSVTNAEWSDKTTNGGKYNNFGYQGDDIFDYNPTGEGKAPNAAKPNDTFLFQSK